MLVYADVKGLELVGAAYLSQDPILITEIVDQVDIHDNNRIRFKLPERRIAKIFVFRLIYGGQAYSYAHDPDFSHISKQQNYWQKIIDEFYAKYQGIQKWHTQLVHTVLDTGKLVMPTGREYHFERSEVAANEWFWRPKILNYPVQGLGADLVAIGRVTAYRRLRKLGLLAKWQMTVHDSVILDTPTEVCYNVCQVIKESFEDVPKNFEKLFGQKFNLPISVEISFGPSLSQLQPYKG